MDDKKTEQLTEKVATPEPNSNSNANKPEENGSNEQLNKIIRKSQYAAIVAVIIFLVWYLVISPMISFSKSEKLVEQAGKDYFDYNYSALPTGNRVATVTLQELYRKSFLKEDIYIPNTKEPCSLEDSWVKVRRVDGEYKYYTYLKCGIRQSNIDHEGPEIVLNGEKEITIARGEEYKEPGIKSVKDNVDGKKDPKEVVIKDSALNINQVGEYEISYTAVDSLNNKSTVKRTVKVIEKLSSAIKSSTEDLGYYTGTNPKNYIYFSGMLFRIIGIDGDNIKLIADEDISNVNYAGINDWLDYYYKHLNSAAKKLVVKNKYCNMSLEETTKTATECDSYTKPRNAYIVSLTDINKSRTEAGTWLEPQSMSWTANPDGSNDKNAYVTRNMFLGSSYTQKSISEDKINNYGVRPIITIKDKVLKSGNGSYESPYNLGETKTGQADDELNTRHSGEYVLYSGTVWRIIEVNSDGTTKVISNDTLKKGGSNVQTAYSTSTKTKQYNPKETGNIGYYIKNKASEYVETSYFVNKNVSVPIYKDEIQYNKEVKTKKYKTKLSAPNMYEMFSAFVYKDDSMQSYWYINSSQKEFIKAAVTDIGVVRTNPIYDFENFGVRVVGNFDEKVIITKGKGTLDNPYSITK